MSVCVTLLLFFICGSLIRLSPSQSRRTQGDKVTQFAAEVTNRFDALEAVKEEVTTEEAEYFYSEYLLWVPEYF